MDKLVDRLFRMDRAERMHAFAEWWSNGEEELPEDEFRALVRDVWIDFEFPHIHVEMWQDIWSRPGIDAIMTRPERQFLTDLPDPVRLWRGYQDRNSDDPTAEDWYGLSWTVERSRGEWFARRFSHTGSPMVAEIKVPKDQLVVVLLERGETEAIYQPRADLRVDVHQVRSSS